MNNRDSLFGVPKKVNLFASCATLHMPTLQNNGANSSAYMRPERNQTFSDETQVCPPRYISNHSSVIPAASVRRAEQ